MWAEKKTTKQTEKQLFQPGDTIYDTLLLQSVKPQHRDNDNSNRDTRNVWFCDNTIENWTANGTEWSDDRRIMITQEPIIPVLAQLSDVLALLHG